VAFLAVAAVATYLVATFDPNAYKPQLVQWVKEKTGGTLAIPGDIKLTLMPPVGVTVGKATFGEAGSERPIASVEEVRVSLGLLPLLNKQVRIDEFHLQGFHANLVRGENGRLNVQELLSPQGTPGEPNPAVAAPPVPMDLDIESITLANGTVSYRDEKTGATYTVGDINLKTGRIGNDRASTLEASGRLQGGQPAMDLAAVWKSGFSFDSNAQRVRLKDVALNVKGAAAGVADLAGSLQGSVDVDIAARAIELAMFSVDVTGSREHPFELEAKLPRLRLTQAAVAGEQAVAKVAFKKADGATTRATLTAPNLEGNSTAFRIVDMALEVDAVRAAQTLKARFTGPVEGDFAEGSFKPAHISVNPLGVQATLSGPDVPNQSVTGALQGSAAVDLAQERMQLDVAGLFDQSAVKAKVGVAGFTAPAYDFDVDIDKLDLTRYQRPKPVQGPTPPVQPGPEPPIDLSALRKLNAHGSIRIGSLTAPKFKASNVRIEVKADDGRIDLDPMAASVYGGSLKGAIGVNAQGTPQLTVKQNLAGVNIGPLLVDLASFERLEGRGNFSVNVSTAGETVTELKKGLNGTATANLVDGAIKGINIAATIRQAKATIRQLKGKQQTEVADTTQKTDFTELKATFTIRHGIASNRDLSGKSPLLRLAGEGDIDLGNDRMNFLLKATLVDTTTGQGGKEQTEVANITVPVRVTGPIVAPTYSIDFTDLAADLAQQALQEEIRKKLGGKLPEGIPGDILQDAVKGLFKR
jgi:AsmA protein